MTKRMRPTCAYPMRRSPAPAKSRTALSSISMLRMKWLASKCSACVAASERGMVRPISMGLSRGFGCDPRLRRPSSSSAGDCERLPIGLDIREQVLTTTTAREEPMRNAAIIAANIFALAVFATGAAGAAEVKVLASNALRTVLQELSPQFEKTTEHKLAITYGSTGTLSASIEKG